LCFSNEDHFRRATTTSDANLFEMAQARLMNTTNGHYRQKVKQCSSASISSILGIKKEKRQQQNPGFLWYTYDTRTEIHCG